MNWFKDILGIDNNKEKDTETKRYSPKTIILPKKFMDEYSSISNMKHIKEMFFGYNIIQKECYVIPIVKSFGKTKMAEENTGILIMDVNSSNLAGLIIEKNYICFFIEVLSIVKRTNKSTRTGIFLVKLGKKDILEWIEDETKIEIKTDSGKGYVFEYYNCKDRNISTILTGESKSNEFKWYLSAISQFLDIMGMSTISPSNWKPK